MLHGTVSCLDALEILEGHPRDSHYCDCSRTVTLNVSQRCSLNIRHIRSICNAPDGAIAPKSLSDIMLKANALLRSFKSCSGFKHGVFPISCVYKK